MHKKFRIKKGTEGQTFSIHALEWSLFIQVLLFVKFGNASIPEGLRCHSFLSTCVINAQRTNGRRGKDSFKSLGTELDVLICCLRMLHTAAAKRIALLTNFSRQIYKNKLVYFHKVNFNMVVFKHYFYFSVHVFKY